MSDRIDLVVATLDEVRQMATTVAADLASIEPMPAIRFDDTTIQVAHDEFGSRLERWAGTRTDQAQGLVDALGLIAERFVATDRALAASLESGTSP